jgi:hypothetical protein
VSSRYGAGITSVHGLFLAASVFWGGALFLILRWAWGVSAGAWSTIAFVVGACAGLLAVTVIVVVGVDWLDYHHPGTVLIQLLVGGTAWIGHAAFLAGGSMSLTSRILVSVLLGFAALVVLNPIELLVFPGVSTLVP